MLRSILAVLAGIIALTLTSFAIEFALNPLLLRFTVCPHALTEPMFRQASGHPTAADRSVACKETRALVYAHRGGLPVPRDRAVCGGRAGPL